MCQREEERCTAVGKNQPDMKLKVHYFYRVPNNGLYVRLNEFNDGSFKIYTENRLNNSNKLSTSHTEEETPLLELSRCKHCGEYVALAMVDINDWTYGPIPTDDSDMFDIDIPNNDNNSTKRYVIFGLSNKQNEKGDNNVKFRILPGARIQPLTPADEKDINGWHIIGNTQCCCPYCNTKQTKRHNSDKDIENDANGNMEDNRLQKFRLSADFISRMMAPSILDQLDKGKSTTGGIVLHDGQQYISFVDSRQAAAMATLKQNLEQERMWLYSTIYHEMCRRQASGMTKEAAMAQIMEAVQTDPMSMMKYAPIMENLNSSDLNVVQRQLNEMPNTHNYMTWSEIAKLIKNDPYCKVFASVFVKRSGESDEIENGVPSDDIIDKYVQSIMVMYLSHRPASAASPETLGLFEACYPKLKQIELPAEVQSFNSILKNQANQITKEDWQDLMQVYLDYTVRNNQSFYLRIPGNDKIDIFSTVRFATEKPRRRPVNKPRLIKGQVSQARIVRYLCALIARDNQGLNINKAQDMYFKEINEVVDAFWETLTGNRYNILQVGQRLNENGVFVNEIDNAPRFNLNNLCFKLYDDVCLCDTKADGKCHTICYRPIGKHFKNFSPYLEGSTPIELDEALHETWDVFPYFKGSGKEKVKKKLKIGQENTVPYCGIIIYGAQMVFSIIAYMIFIFSRIYLFNKSTPLKLTKA